MCVWRGYPQKSEEGAVALKLDYKCLCTPGAGAMVLGTKQASGRTGGTLNR